MTTLAQEIKDQAAEYGLLGAWLGSDTTLADTWFLADCYASALEAGGRVFIFGNGGSAADAAHIAAEFQGRYRVPSRAPLAVIALTTDQATLTAVGNDFGYEYVFARQLVAQARPGDVAVALSTSGESKNLVRAFEALRVTCPQALRFAFGPSLRTTLARAAGYSFAAPFTRSGVIQAAQLALHHQVACLVDAWAARGWDRERRPSPGVATHDGYRR